MKMKWPLIAITILFLIATACNYPKYEHLEEFDPLLSDTIETPNFTPGSSITTIEQLYADYFTSTKGQDPGDHLSLWLAHDISLYSSYINPTYIDLWDQDAITWAYYATGVSGPPIELVPIENELVTNELYAFCSGKIEHIRGGRFVRDGYDQLMAIKTDNGLKFVLSTSVLTRRNEDIDYGSFTFSNSPESLLGSFENAISSGDLMSFWKLFIEHDNLVFNMGSELVQEDFRKEDHDVESFFRGMSSLGDNLTFETSNIVVEIGDHFSMHIKGKYSVTSDDVVLQSGDFLLVGTAAPTASPKWKLVGGVLAY